MIEKLNNPKIRKEVFAKNFPLFFMYHFGRKNTTKFQKERMQSMQSKSNTMITAFRASRKTTIARGYVVWCIIHKTEPHIVVQSYEDTLSSERVREVAKMLFKKKIIQDY
jgi:phage terminase large subunit GpA-like protein